MAEEEEADSKPFEASPRKLEEARKRGEVPLSQDAVTALVYVAAVVSIFFYGAWMFLMTGEALVLFLKAPEEIAISGMRSIALGLIVGAGAWFVLPYIAALLGAGLQGALVFAPTKLRPKISRISPISIAKQKYGPDGIFNFLKSFAKLLIYSTVLAMICWSWRKEILLLPELSVRQGLASIGEITQSFLLVAVIAMAAIAAIDAFWQRAQFLKKQRMSLKELKDETKETEGDPHTKQARRQISYGIVTNQMLAEVPKADVVVVNPQHFAVALSWDRSKGTAPECVAKGVDEIAARIREVAQENGVPIYRDPPTARALHATLEIGQQILPDHYRAIAAAIRFADSIRAKAKGGWA